MMHEYLKMGNVCVIVSNASLFMHKIPAMSMACPCCIYAISGHSLKVVALILEEIQEYHLKS